MPSNKNAVTRYKFLDDMLSDRHHCYDIHDLTDKCNEKLVDYGFPEVTQRCIEKDINYLEFAPFYADIERYMFNGKHCIRYANQSFSIFTKSLSDEESNLLSEVLCTIGQFDGLNNFEWLDSFKKGLELQERPKVISFSNNPYLKNSNLLGSLFDAISNRVVILITYHTFSNPEPRERVVHPYLLKQFRDRWYLVCAADDDKFILQFALDRIDKIESLPDRKYYPCQCNLEERYEDIIGVTLPKDKEAEDILIWVSDREYDYISTKPLHGSQKVISKEKETDLRQKYPNLTGGHFISLQCIDNFELKRELCAYFDGLVVLEPEHLRNEISELISKMNDRYFALRT